MAEIFDTPPHAGFYWYKDEDNEVTLVEVHHDGDILLIGNEQSFHAKPDKYYRPDFRLCGQWIGPLEIPEAFGEKS